MQFKRIPLTQNKFAIVDADDYEILSQFKWHVKSNRHTCYAVRSNGSGSLLMHRQILNAPPELYCDHINHNGLDNRKCNLRLCTPAQNTYNKRPSENKTSRYKGVCFDVVTRKWRAKIEYKGLTKHIGCYDFEADAAIAYDDWAIELFAEFAWLNHQNRPEIQQWISDCYLFT